MRTAWGIAGALILGSFGLSFSGCGAAITGTVIGIIAGQKDSDDATNNNPAVSVTTPSGTVNDIVTIAYRLTDPEGDRANVRVEYRVGNNAFQAATPAFVEGAEGTSNLTTSATGVDHEFFWNTSQDLGIMNVDLVEVRITPIKANDTTSEGDPATTNDFLVSNLFITTLAQRPVSTVVTPIGMAIDPTSNHLYIADGGHRLVQVDGQTGEVKLLAGNGEAGLNGNRILASQAQLNIPISVGVTGNGELVVADVGNGLVRLIDTNKFIVNLAGDGDQEDDGDLVTQVGVLGADASVEPRDLAIDRFGNPFILEQGRLRFLNLQSTPNLSFPLDPGDCLGLGVAPVVPAANVFTVLSTVPISGNMYPSPSFCRTFLRRASALALHDTSDAVRYAVVLEAGFGFGTSTPRIVVANLGTQAITLQSVKAGGPVMIQPGTVDEIIDRANLPGFLGSSTFPDIALSPNGQLLLLSVDNANSVYAYNFSASDISIAGSTVPAGGGVVVVGSGEQGLSGDGGDPLNAQLTAPTSVVLDANMNIFIGEGVGRLRVVPSQTFTLGSVTIAANKVGTLNTVLPNTVGKVIAPGALTLAPSGDLLVADTDASDARSLRLLRISAKDANVTTILGSGQFGDGGDGGPADKALLSQPVYSSISSDGRFALVADADAHRVRAVNLGTTSGTFLGVTIQPGQVETVVGTGIASVNSQVGDGGSPRQASLSFPVTALFGPAGLLWISDAGNYRIRVCNPTTQAVTVLGVSVSPNTIRTVIGNGDFGNPSDDGDGGAAASAKLGGAAQLFGPDGRLYVLDGIIEEIGAPRVRFVNTTSAPITINGVTTAPNAINTIVGDGQVLDGPPTEGEAALQASFRSLRGMSVRGDGLMFIPDALDHRIRAVNLSLNAITIGGVAIAPGRIRTVVGTGIPSFDGESTRVAAGLFGVTQGGAINEPFGLHAFDDGRLVFCDTQNGAVRLANLSDQSRSFGGVEAKPGQVVVLAGSRSGRARASGPVDVKFDSTGLVLFSDNGAVGNRPAILQLDPRTRLVTRVAGTLDRGSNPNEIGDGKLALFANFFEVAGIHVDSTDSIYVADRGARRIRFVNRSSSDQTPILGVTIKPAHIDTLLGGGSDGDPDDDDGLLVTDPSFSLYDPVSVSRSGNVLWVVDQGFAQRVLRIDMASGTVAGIYSANPLILVPGGGPATGEIPNMPNLAFNELDDLSGVDFVAAGVLPGDVLQIDAVLPGGAQLLVDGAPAGLPASITITGLQGTTGVLLESAVATDMVGPVQNAAYQVQREDEPTAVVAISATEAYVAFRSVNSEAGRIFRLTRGGSTWTVAHVAGSGRSDWNGDLLAPTAMNFGEINGMTLDGNVLYVTDIENHRIVAINLNTSGEITLAGLKIKGGEARTICGGGQGDGGFNGDAIPPHLALLNEPSGVAVGATGQVVVVDKENGRIRRFQGK